MLGTAAAGLLKGCPGVSRAGAAAVVVGARSFPAALGRRPGHGALLSSMTASRSGSDRDSFDEDKGADQSGAGKRAGAGGGVLSRHPLPPRTVPDEILGFTCRTYMAGDSDDRYPNIHGVHPAEFKVGLSVPVPLLGLSPKEEERLIQLVGPRYKEKGQELKLVSDRFPNRIDNKRYLVNLLENILVEARNVDDE